MDKCPKCNGIKIDPAYDIDINDDVVTTYGSCSCGHEWKRIYEFQGIEEE